MAFKSKKRAREYHREWRLKNKDKDDQYRLKAKEGGYCKKYNKEHREDKRRWRLDNKAHIKERDKLYRIRTREKRKQYCIDHRKRRAKWQNNRYHNDVQYMLKNNIGGRIRNFLTNGTKSKTTEELLGCSFKELKLWLENQFTKGMTWDNYGEWHIDHVYPCAKFNLKQPYEQKICFNWFNLQPMWATENISKGAKLNIE